jgi:SAM-dependent methyltransferase
MKNEDDVLRRHSDYYRGRAASYVASEQMETQHEMAIATMCGLAKVQGWTRFLDVGAGSGRGMCLVRKLLPDVSVTGIEPMEDLRSVARGRGIAEADIRDGNALDLKFDDSSIDCVYATGILHHISQPRAAIVEMFRVADKALVLSDLNNFGCGSTCQRLLSHSMRRLGLWKMFQFLKNGFKHEKFSKGDGIHYSYSLFDDIPILHALGGEVFLLTTDPSCGNPFWDSGHVALIVLKSKAS